MSPIILLIAALSLLVAAKPVPLISSSTSAALVSPYTVMALHSGTALQFAPMNAANFSFYFGGETQSVCPEDVSSCPPGNVTAFTPDGSLDVAVPAGQVVYVLPDGQIGFSEAHSDEYPDGAVLDPFVFSPEDSETFTGTITITAFGANGIMGCPDKNGNYQAYAAMANATVPTGCVDDCIGVDAVTLNYTGTGAAAWEYD